MSTPETGCPSEETVAAFIDRRLESAAHARVIEHMRQCDDCYSVITASAFETSVPPTGLTLGRSRHLRSLILWTSAAAVAVMAVLFLPSIRSVLRTKSGIEVLIDASEDARYRPIEGRLSGGFSYKPVDEPMRGETVTGAPADGHSRRLTAAALEIQKATDPHALGVAHLLLGDAEACIATLEGSIRSETGSDEADEAISRSTRPALLSDLSAAYYSRAKRRDFASDYTAALHAAESAWRRSKTPEIAWNRAIAASELRLVGIADRAWDDFLRIADQPEWRREANARRAALHGSSEADVWRSVQSGMPEHASALDEMIMSVPGPALRYFDEELLPEWAAARIAGRDSKAALELARRIARHLSALGDAFPADAVAAIDRACFSRRRCDAAARGHLAYAEGERHFREHRFTLAAGPFAKAESAFSEIGSPYVHAARIRRAGCRLAGNEFREALQRGREILAEVESTKYRIVAARAHWLVGLSELHAGHPEESLEHYQAAHELFAQNRDTANLAAMDLLTAEALETAGDPDRAIEYHKRALERIALSGDRSRYGLTVYMAGHAAMMRGRVHAARVLLDEAMQVSVNDRSFAIASLGARWQAAMAWREKDVQSGVRYSEMASRFADAVQDTPLRARIAAYAYGGPMSGSGFVDASKRALDQAIDFFTSTGDRSWLPQLLQQRASIHRTEGDLVSAERDLRNALETAEEVLRTTSSNATRDAFIANIDQAYADLIDLLMSSGRSREALEIAERERLLGRKSAMFTTAEEAVTAIPAGVSVAVLAWRRESLVAWIRSGGELRAVEWAATPPAVADAVRRMEETGHTADSLSQLYDILLRPWLPAGGGELWIVPAQGMESVPFAALVDRATGRSIVDRFAVSTALNLTSIAESIRDRPSAAPERLLIVADPAYETMPRLPATRTEALQVMRHYGGADLLTRENATAPRISQALQNATAFHFAGHAVVNELTPEMSALIVAGSGSDDADGRLYVHDLVNRRLPLELVVLSACSTARTRGGRPRGNMTIARAFLNAGTSTVVGTLWPVRDHVAAMFSARLHQELKAGVAPSEAVRAAQLHVRSRYADVADWGAFCVMRGGTAGEENR
jgi:tetratricopeptide (TPR) repeat protein